MNLARLGNKNVAEKYNLSAMHEAAVRITQITTGSMPYPRTEVYGSQAMDVVFPDGGMGSAGMDLSDLLGCKKNIRVSPFTNEDMMAQKLNDVFGEHEWEKFVLNFMIIVSTGLYLSIHVTSLLYNSYLNNPIFSSQQLIHLDLERGFSFEYQGPAGLLDLYLRAGGTDNTEVMNKVLVEKSMTQGNNAQLLRDLRRKFDLCRDSAIAVVSTPLNDLASKTAADTKKLDNQNAKMSLAASLAVSKFKRNLFKKVQKTSDTLSYEEFYQGFMGPYHAHANINPLESKVVMDTLHFLDSNGSG